MTSRKSKTHQPSEDGFLTSVAGAKGGKGGGGSSRTPREDPDSLHSTAYARVIDFISEGEIYGPTHGGDGLADLLLDGTRVKNEDGSVNIPGVSVQFRAGTQYQDPINGFPASESTTGVGLDLKESSPWTRTFTDTQLSALRVNLTTTQYEVKANGDRVGYRIEYAIDLSTDNGPFSTVVSASFDGKTTSVYNRSHRIDLPAATQNWRLRVRRLTPDSKTDLITAVTRIESVVGIVDARLRYPMSALAGIVVDASQFQSVPTRAYDMKGRIVRVPSNYDADNYTYFGTWDGTFKQSWTDCPAWIFYDMVSNDRYGLGHLVPAGMLDKWGLYEIGRYCDEQVPDGFGGAESRFSCNVYLQQAADAYRVLQDLAGVFRGMSYAVGGGIFASADMPSDPADWYTFSNSNVINGEFTYAGTSHRSRSTVALVSWSDRSDLGRQKVEVVEDRDAIARFGLRETEISAFACTSQGQAHRIGRWALLTSQVDTGTITFETGLEHAHIMPGKVIRVADQYLAGRRLGGRLHSATVTRVVVDAVETVRAGDRLTVTLPSGITQERIISDVLDVDGRALELRVATPFTTVPVAQAQWTVESTELSYQTFRILSVVMKDGLIAEIVGLQHTPSKYAVIDYGTKLETKPVTVIPPSVQPPPTNVTISSFSVIDQGVATHNASIAWSAAPGAVAYEVQFRQDNSGWVPAGRTGGNSLDVRGIHAGAYTARVRAINGLEISSYWSISSERQLEGNVGAPPSVAFLTAAPLFAAIRLDWGFLDLPNIIGRTEVWYGRTAALGDAIKLGDFAYPQNTHTIMGLAHAQEFWFWARVVDKNGVPGPFYPIGAGVRGQSSNDASLILDLIAGQIDETLLSDVLRTEIGRIKFDLIKLEAEQGINDAAITDLLNADKAVVASLSAEVRDRIAQYHGVVNEMTALANALVAANTAILAETNARIAVVGVVAQSLAAETAARVADVNAILASAAGMASDIQAVNQAVTKEVSDRIADVNGLEAAVSARVGTIETEMAGLLGTESYDNAKSYVLGNLVKSGGKLYRAKKATQGIAPPNTTSWELVGEYDSLGAAVADLASRSTSLELVTEAQANKIGTLESTSATSTASIATLQQTTATQATRLDQLAVKTDGQAASISNLQDVTGAQATQITTLRADVNGQGTSITSLNNVTAALATRTTTLEGRSESLDGDVGAAKAQLMSLQQVSDSTAFQVLQLTAEAGNNDAELVRIEKVTADQANVIERLRVTDGIFTSQIESIQTVQAGQASLLTTLSTTVSGQGALITNLQTTTASQATAMTALTARTGTAESNITRLDGVTAAQAQTISTLGTTVGGNTNAITAIQTTNAQMAERVTTLESSSAGGSAAITELQRVQGEHATTLTTLTSTVGGHTTSIQALNQTTATQAQQYVELKATVDGHTSSISTLNTVTAGQTSSITALVTRADGFDSSITLINQTTAAQATRLSNVETKASDAVNRVQVLEQTDALSALRFLQLESGIGNYDASITDLYTTGENMARTLLVVKVSSELATSAITELRAVTADTAGRMVTVETTTTTLTNRTTSLEQTTASQATRIGLVETLAGTNETAVETLTQTTGTLALDVTTLKASDETQNASIVDLRKVQADLAYLSLQLQAEAGNADASFVEVYEIQAGAARRESVLIARTDENTASIRTLSQTVTTETTALATQITNLTARVGNTETVGTNNTAAITAEATARASADSAMTLRIDTAYTRIGDNAAAITTEAQTRATNDGALSTRIDTLNATTGNISAAIQTETTARIEDDQVQASRIDTLQVTVGQHTASIQTISSIQTDVNGQLNAQHVIKMETQQDGRQVAVGIALGIESVGGIMQSQMLFEASRFAFINRVNGNTVLPMAIENGQVIINDAIIARLDAAKISFGQMSGERIQVGTLAANRIEVNSLVSTLANIQDAYIVRANIHWAQVDYLRIAGQSATVWAQFSHGGMYVDKAQANYQLFGFYTYYMPDASDCIVMLNPWQDMASVNYSYSKAYIFRLKHEQTGRIYEGIESASQPRTYGANTGLCRVFSFGRLPAGDQTFTVFVKPDQTAFAGGIPGESPSDAENPDNPGKVSNGYSTTARFTMSVLSAMR